MNPYIRLVHAKLIGCAIFGLLILYRTSNSLLFLYMLHCIYDRVMLELPYFYTTLCIISLIEVLRGEKFIAMKTYTCVLDI